VTTINVKMPTDVTYYREKRLLTDMDVYFNRPTPLHHLTYTPFFTQFVYCKKKRARMTAADENVNYFQVQMPQISVSIYICKRNGDCHLVRVLMIYLTAAEVWYLRILLFNRPCKSFEDSLTHNGELYTIF
jgi:hypothetical protein